MDMFYGIYVSVIVSKDTNEVQTMKPESFFVLDLHIDNNIETPQTLYYCLDTYVKPEILEGYCAWYNDCLLYTSPSPRDRTRSRMPSSA